MGNVIGADSIAPKWTPRHIASKFTTTGLNGGLALWFDPYAIRDAVGFSSATETYAIASWPDKSRLGNDAAQSTAADKPQLHEHGIYGHPTVNFEDADTEYLTCGFISEIEVGSGDYGWACCMRFTSNSAATQTVFQKHHTTSGGAQGGGLNFKRKKSASNNEVYAAQGGTATIIKFQEANAVQDTDWHVFSATRIGSTFTCWLDGTQADTVSSDQDINDLNPGNSTDFVLGGKGSAGTSNPLDAYLGDFVFVGGTLNDANRQKLEGYLAHKYDTDSGSTGATNSVSLLNLLPAAHPYKSNPPSGSLGLGMGNNLTHTGTKCNFETSGGLRWPMNEVQSIQLRG